MSLKLKNQTENVPGDRLGPCFFPDSGLMLTRPYVLAAAMCRMKLST